MSVKKNFSIFLKLHEHCGSPFRNCMGVLSSPLCRFLKLPSASLGNVSRVAS